MNERVVLSEPVQHLPDIVIPVIEITEGWAAKDCVTHADCDDAFAYLMAACAQIEYQIDIELAKPKGHQAEIWLAKARCALKFKKAALQIVNQKRSAINEADKTAARNTHHNRLLEVIRASVPDDQFMAWLREADRRVNSHTE